MSEYRFTRSGRFIRLDGYYYQNGGVYELEFSDDEVYGDEVYEELHDENFSDEDKVGNVDSDDETTLPRYAGNLSSDDEQIDHHLN